MALAASAQGRQERVGWRMVEDPTIGAQLGIPTKLAPHQSKSRSGTRWQSAQGQVQIETFRIREPGTTLSTVFEDQKREPPNRQLASSALRGDHFVLSGMQGLKRFLVRAEVRDLEIRGITVLYDQAIEGTVEHVAAAVISAFAPFPGSGVMALIGPPSRRKVEYGTGIVVTAAGHVLTDLAITEGCTVLQVAGQGDASRIAAHEAAGLDSSARVRRTRADAGCARPYRRERLRADAGRHPRSAGTARRPSADNSDRTTQRRCARADATTRLRRRCGARQPRPLLRHGDAEGAGAGERGRRPRCRRRRWCRSTRSGNSWTRNISTPATGSAGVEAAKASVVRVICVRR